MGTTGGRAAKPRPEALSTTDDALDAACAGVRRKRRDLSARHVLSLGQIVFFAATGGLIYWVAREGRIELALAWTTLFVIGSAIFALAVALRLVATGAIMKTPMPPAATWTEALPIYTLLCPLRREAASLPALIAALRQLDYPGDRLDVRLVVEDDDTETLEALDNVALPREFTVVHVPMATPRTKPKALNYALFDARGDFVVVYDAEDVPDRRQLRAALDAFATGGEKLGAVQAPLLIDNGRASWISGQFAAEYAIQFLGVVPLLTHFKLPPPLGGTSNHFRRKALEDVGAWDPHNVTEDADLGYRLSRFGWRIGDIAPPTWEEAPEKLVPWLRQRARWIKGHLQTWLVLMRNPVRTMREMGVGAFFAMQLVLGGGLLAAVAHGPLLVFLASIPFTGMAAPHVAALTLVIVGYATAALAALFAAAKLKDPRLGLAALTMPLYWPLSTIAAAWAVFQLVVRPHHWSKTDHGRARRNTPV
ncbi:MAG: glycosyltransferase [Alphaproteobacteria bacterium]|nr:glycosyltransferase [Alphaproteobacteria bacterium]